MIPSVTSDVPVQGGFRRAGAAAAAWQTVALVTSKGAVLVSTIVLARLLLPEQFGLVSLAVVVVGYMQVVADAGVGQALIRLPDDRATVRAATACAAAVGLALVVGAVAASPLIAGFFHRPDLAPLVAFCAISLIAASLGSVPESLLRRNLQFRRITLARVLSAIATAIVSIVLAFSGAGAWAIAWGQVVGAFSFTLAAWLMLDEKPDLALWRTRRQDLRGVLAFGVPVAGAAFLARIIFDVDYLIVGRVLGAEQLAFYTLAFKLPEIAILSVFYVIIGVTFPLFARAREDPERLRRGYLLSFQLQSLYGLMAGAGLAAIAPLAIHLFFGDKWAAATIPLVALALYAALRTVGGGANEIYKAVGKPGISIWISALRLVVLVPALILATRWGINGVAWMQVIVTVLFAIGMQSVAARVLALRAGALLRTVGPPLVAAAGVALVAWPLARLPVPSVVALLLAVAGGAAAGFLVLAVLFRPVLTTALSLAGRGRG